MDTIIDEIGFDAKHSYEDNIIHGTGIRKMGSRITVLGGIDIDFILGQLLKPYITVQPLCLKKHQGAYALGSGNSILSMCHRKTIWP